MVELTHFSSTSPFIPLENIGKLARFLKFPDVQGGKVRLKRINSSLLFELISYQIFSKLISGSPTKI